MLCELCQEEAVGACQACGAVFCADHAPSFCFRCAKAISQVSALSGSGSSTAVVSGDRQPRPSGKGYLQCEASGRPTIHVEDTGPPACYRCLALARQMCRNCQALFCPQHAGSADLCDICARSSRLGVIVFLAMLAVVIILLVWVWVMGGR